MGAVTARVSFSARSAWMATESGRSSSRSSVIASSPREVLPVEWPRMHEKTFTIGEARASLPSLRRLLVVVREERASLAKLHPFIDLARERAEQNGGTPFGELFLNHAFR